MTVPLVLALKQGDPGFRASVAELFASEPQPEAVEAVAEGIMKHGGIRETGIGTGPGTSNGRSDPWPPWGTWTRGPN